ncbi:aspartate aminotransferase family protein [Paenarthrobacter aromaticivorans]|uniref:Aspartate aminotransferase family protein n=1 Tax=Paenarthrobacter aromaticivorans TaxID=2849150 RepID=A0ABS6I330_9MICC|nr:aspartate aminotransferase family protein [Paenarthrobacter sp. MMS21-TAE1-1]MBU8865757.1 aspartate aminotransferase family protein [Paenarthrobacter sp. MMS21-TAE1-1]
MVASHPDTLTAELTVDTAPDVEDATAITNAEAVDLDRSNVFHSWSAQKSLNPLAIAGGSGSTVWDHDGNTYLDFSSQLVNTNIGHQHPKLIAAIAQQATTLATLAPSHASHVRGQAAAKILSHAPANMEKVFFTNGGADANENAIRMARLHTGRDKVISRYRSYHGNTGAAIVATGDWRRIPNEYSRGHVHVFGPYLYRSEFWAETPEQETERALQHLRRTIQCEGPQSIAAILLETVPGTAGILVPTAEYLQGVRALCDDYGIVMILDEVMAGFGRTGDWFALDAFDVTPDLITFAKGVNSGYVPVGGVIISGEIAATFDERVFPGGLTYSGHPLAAASVVASIEAFEEEDIIGNAARIGRDHLEPGLRALADKHDVIGEVRGRGVFWALELVQDRQSRTPVTAEYMGRVKAELLRLGLLPFIADNRIHVVPPAVVTPEEVVTALAIYDQALTAVER